MVRVSEESGAREWLVRQAASLREEFRDFRDRVIHERSMRLMGVLALVVFILALVVWAVERAGTPPGADGRITSFGRALYWMFISGTTTGYGDLIPHTPLARAMTVAMILTSMILTSILTATIASWFVEKRLLEGKGMENITWKNHTVICGWNVNARPLIEAVYKGTMDGAELVLVNNLPDEEITELLYRYKRQGLRFVRGDFVHESILTRANVAHAKNVVILADGDVENGFKGADERTILCAMTVKSMNRAVRVCAELVDENNVSHLKRAQVDHIVVMAEHNDFLLSSSVIAPGVTLAFQELLDPDSGALIKQVKIPAQLVGKKFSDLSSHFKQKRNALVIGVVSEEERGMTLQDILSADMSGIDLFIKRQFEGMEDDYFVKKASTRVRLNPGDDYLLDKGDWALLIEETEAGRLAS